MRASGTKYANPLQNECAIDISGLNDETRDFILTETSPYNKHKTPPRVIVECGRVSTGLHVVFVGDITEATISSPPDVDLSIKAKTNNGNNAKVVTTDGIERISLRELSNIVAQNNGLLISYHATDKQVANYAYAGSASAQIQDLQRVGGVRAFVDDGVLFVKDERESIKDRVRVLNMNSGLVGIPKPTDKGLEVTYLIDGESQLGGTLRLDSKMNKSLNGDYVINQLKFDIATHSDEFYYTALCERKE